MKSIKIFLINYFEIITIPFILLLIILLSLFGLNYFEIDFYTKLKNFIETNSMIEIYGMLVGLLITSYSILFSFFSKMTNEILNSQFYNKLNLVFFIPTILSLFLFILSWLMIYKIFNFYLILNLVLVPIFIYYLFLIVIILYKFYKILPSLKK